MNATKITAEELALTTVAALPPRPNAPGAFGGAGYTSSDLKKVFDRLPLLLAERYNSLLDDVETVGEGSLAASIPTGISEDHTLSDLFSDVKNGNLAAYMKIGDKSLYSIINSLLFAVFGEGLE